MFGPRATALIAGAVLAILGGLDVPAAQAATPGPGMSHSDVRTSPVPPVLPVAHVDGVYRIVSTDCYFGAGACSQKFDIEQHGDTLTAIGDTYFHGRISGGHVHFGETWPPGVSEDSWYCQGTSSDGGHTVAGTMTDGIGGSGTFRLTFLHQ